MLCEWSECIYDSDNRIKLNNKFADVTVGARSECWTFFTTTFTYIVSANDSTISGINDNENAASAASSSYLTLSIER